MPALLRSVFIILISFHLTKNAAAFQGRYVPRQKFRSVETKLTPIYHEYYQNCVHKICSDVDDYPEQEIYEALTKENTLEGMFGIVLTSTFNITNFATNRYGGIEITESLCSTESPATLQPRVMRNQKGHWKYVVNVGQFQQSFTSEFCRSNGKSNPRDTFCNEFGAECDQDFQEMFLLTFENGTFDFDKFMIPTTCKCLCN